MSVVFTHAACTMLGYDGAGGMSDDGAALPDLDPEHTDASANHVGDSGSTRTNTGDGSVTSPTQSADAGDSADSGADDKSFNTCGLSSWLPGLIPDLSVIPNIPGITVACTDAGTSPTADAGARDAGSTVDAGKPDAAVQPVRDAGSDASVLDASTDAAAPDASQDASTTVTSDAGGDAASDATTLL